MEPVFPQKWNQMVNSEPLHELSGCFVSLHRLTPEEIRMHTLSSKKRTAESLRTSLKPGTAAPPSAKRFKRIVLPCDNSDEEEGNGSPFESGSKTSSRIGNMRSLSMDCRSARNSIRKSKQIYTNTCQGANQQLCRTDVQDGKRLSIEKVLPDSSSNSDSSCGSDGSEKTSIKNHSNKCIENKLSKLDQKKQLGWSASDMFIGAKDQLSKKLIKGKRKENTVKPALVFPPRTPDRTLLTESRTLSSAKHTLKTPGKQESFPVLSTNKDESRKLNKLSLPSGHGYKVIEKVPIPSKVDDKLKSHLINNEKAQHSLKVKDKSGTSSKIVETTRRQQEEFISTVVHDQSLKTKCNTPVSVIFAENIEDLMDEYEQLTTNSLSCKNSGEKRNDKKPSQKKMLNMFGEEHLVEDSQSIYQSPSICLANKEKMLFPDLASTSNQFDNAKKTDISSKVKHVKINYEAAFCKSKDVNFVKGNTKKRKLSEPMENEILDKSRRHSVDVYTEKSSKTTNSISLGKRDSTNCQKKAQTNITISYNDSKNSGGSKSPSLNTLNCVTACTVGKSNKVSDLGNENFDCEQIKKTKHVKDSECLAEKLKHLENGGKKDLELKKFKEKSGCSISRRDLKTSKNCEASENKTFEGLEENLNQMHQEKSDSNRQKEHGTVVGNVSSKKIEKENFCENKKAHSSVKETQTKNKNQVLYIKLQKNKATSGEVVKVTSTDTSRQQEDASDSLKRHENLCDIQKYTLTEKENSERAEEIEILGGCLNNGVSTTEVVSSSSVSNSLLINDGDVRTFQQNNSSTTSNSADNNFRSPLYSSLNEKEAVVRPIENLIDECSSLTIEEELQRLEHAYESLDKWVGDASTKKLLILQRMESLQGIEVIQKVKQEVTDDDDDDCKVIFPSDDDTSTVILKEENDRSSSVTTEVLDWSNESTISHPNEQLQGNNSTTSVNSPTVIVEGFVLAHKVGNGETSTVNDNVRLISSDDVDNSASGPQKKNAKFVTSSSNNKASNCSSETVGHSAINQLTGHVEVLDDCNSRLVSSTTEVSTSAQHRNGDGCSGNLNKVVGCSPVIVQNSTNVQKNVSGENARSSQQKRNVDFVGESSTTRLNIIPQVSVDETSVSEQCPGNHLPDNTVVTKSRESEVAVSSVSPGTQSSASQDKGHSVAIREERIRVRGIDDLLARPKESAVAIYQQRGSANATGEDAFLNDYFSDQEGINAFRELVKVMLVLGKVAESYLQLRSTSLQNQQPSSVPLNALILQHCLYIYRLCGKVISSYKDNPDYFPNVLFLQMVAKWQNYSDKFCLSHLKLLLKKSFEAVLKLDCRPVFQKQVLTIWTKMKLFSQNPKQVHSSMQNVSETSCVAESSHQSYVSNVIVPNNSSSQTQLISVPSSENPGVITQRETLNVPASSHHSFVPLNIVPSRGEWIQPVVGQRTLQSDISSTTGQTNPTCTQYQGHHIINAPQMNNQTHSTMTYGNASNICANTGPIYKPPPPYSSATDVRQNPCQQVTHPTMLVNGTPNYNVAVTTQKNTSHLKNLLELTNTVQIRGGIECVSQTMLNPLYQVHTAPIALQQQLQNPPSNNLSAHQAMPTSSNQSNVSVSGQRQFPHNNYQLQQTQRSSYHAPYLQKTNLTSQQNPANESPFHATLVQESNSNLHHNQRPVLQASSLLATTSQHHPVTQRISLMTSSLLESNSLHQQPSSSRRPSFETQPIREPNAVNQQQPIGHRTAVDMSSLREATLVHQQHPPAQGSSVNMSSLRDPSVMHQQQPSAQRSSANVSSRESNVMHQQHTQKQSYSASASKVPNQPLPSTSQRPTFIASSIRDSTHQQQLQNQVQVLRSNNLVENYTGIPKNMCHQTSGDDPQYNSNVSELYSTVRVTQAPERNQNMGTNNKEKPTAFYNSNNNRTEVLTLMKKSNGSVVHWYGQDRQSSNHFNTDVTDYRGADHLNVHQNVIAQPQVPQTVLNQHGTISEPVKGRLPSNVKLPDKSNMKLSYSIGSFHQNMNNTQQLDVEQYTSRPSIIHTISQNAVELRNPNEHTPQVLDQLHSYHKSSSHNILQGGLHSSTFYDSNVHTKNVGIGSHVYNNTTMNYMGKVDAGSSAQPLLTSLASPVYDTSPGSLPEEYDQMRVQVMGRSVSRDSGYRSPSQGTESIRETSVSCSGNCCVCHKETSQFCSRCTTVFYCSTECQIRDWSRHKTDCKESS